MKENSISFLKLVYFKAVQQLLTSFQSLLCEILVLKTVYF